MPDVLTPDQRHRNMVAIRSASTKPEQKLRHALWHLSFRYKVNDRRLPGSPDIVLPKYHTVIFIHGCFWHGHKGCKYFTVPKTNTEFWRSKIVHNQQRDQEVWRLLEAKGWAVIIVWECQLKRAVFDETIANVKAEILRNGEVFSITQEARRKAREEYQLQRKTEKERQAALLAEVRAINRTNDRDSETTN